MDFLSKIGWLRMSPSRAVRKSHHTFFMVKNAVEATKDFKLEI